MDISTVADLMQLPADNTTKVRLYETDMDGSRRPIGVFTRDPDSLYGGYFWWAVQNITILPNGEITAEVSGDFL